MKEGVNRQTSSPCRPLYFNVYRTFMYVCVCVCVCVCMYDVCVMYVCVMYVCMYVSMYVCIYMCVLCMHVCIYVCVCIYIINRCSVKLYNLDLCEMYSCFHIF
jgi:hypothetical protein